MEKISWVKVLNGINKLDIDYEIISHNIFGKSFELKKVKVKDIIDNDKDLQEFLSYSCLMGFNQVSIPIIIGTKIKECINYQNAVIDGYHRIEQCLFNGEKEILAYVQI